MTNTNTNSGTATASVCICDVLNMDGMTAIVNTITAMDYDTFMQSPALPALLQFLWINAVIELTTGYWLAFNFQVSHISTLAEFPLNTECKLVN